MALAITIGEECDFIFPNVGQPQPLLKIPQEERLVIANTAAKRNNVFFFIISAQSLPDTYTQILAAYVSLRLILKA